MATSRVAPSPALRYPQRINHEARAVGESQRLVSLFGAGDFDLLEFFESRFDLLEIESANATDFHHRNDTGACPVTEAAAADVEPLGGLLRGEQFGGRCRRGGCVAHGTLTGEILRMQGQNFPLLLRRVATIADIPPRAGSEAAP